MRKLKRVAGNPLVAEFSLAPRRTRRGRVADPNGYYEVLGLEPDAGYSQADLKAAYREQVKLFHPDGATPDPEVFELIQTAYEVLSNQESREQYDALDGTQVWLDGRLTNLLVQKLHAAGLLQPKDIAIEELRRRIGEEAGVEPRPMAPFDGYCYYYYEGEVVPEKESREAWFESVKAAMWDRGHRSREVKVGFTTGEPHVVEKGWGRVLMVAGEPSTERAEVLMDFYLSGATSPA